MSRKCAVIAIVLVAAIGLAVQSQGVLYQFEVTGSWNPTTSGEFSGANTSYSLVLSADNGGTSPQSQTYNFAMDTSDPNHQVSEVHFVSGTYEILINPGTLFTEGAIFGPGISFQTDAGGAIIPNFHTNNDWFWQNDSSREIQLTDSAAGGVPTLFVGVFAGEEATIDLTTATFLPGVVVPEPSSLLLAAIALVGLGLLRRQR